MTSSHSAIFLSQQFQWWHCQYILCDAYVEPCFVLSGTLLYGEKCNRYCVDHTTIIWYIYAHLFPGAVPQKLGVSFEPLAQKPLAMIWHMLCVCVCAVW